MQDPTFQYADMGGSYIGPAQKRISKLANELGLNLHQVNDNERAVFMDKVQIIYLVLLSLMCVKHCIIIILVIIIVIYFWY